MRDQLLRIVLLLVATLSLAACAPRDPIRIGFIGGLSERFADLGSPGRNGAEMAIIEQNARGGINGHQLELVVRDDMQDNEVAKQAFDDLVKSGVIGVVGPMTSSIAVTLAPLAEKVHRVLVSPTAATARLSERDDHFFRVIASTADYAKQAATYHRRTLGIERAALVIDLANRDYTESWAENYQRTFEEEGGTVSGIIRFNSLAEHSHEEIASKILAVRPQMAIFVCSSVDASLLAQKLHWRAHEIRLAGSGWSGTEQLIRLGGAAVEGMLVEQYFNRNDTSPAYQAFARNYRNRYGQSPGYAAVTGYDAATVIIEGLKRNADPEQLKSTLLQIGTFPGVQSPVVFDQYGNNQRRAYLTNIVGGAFQQVE